MGSPTLRVMVLVVNTEGKFWDGFSWSQKGREFFSIASAVRSLHENGEDVGQNVILTSYDSPSKPPSRDTSAV